MPGRLPIDLPLLTLRKVSLRRWIVIYAAAALLPWGAAYLSLQIQSLHAIPLALNFAAIAAAAAFLGEGPAIVGVFASALAYQLYLPMAMRAGPADTLIRLAVILLAGGLITLVINQRYTALERLQSAMDVLQEQRDILVQAQQASNSAAWTYDSRKQQTQWYEGGAEIFGRPHQEVIAAGSPRQFVMPEDLVRLDQAAAVTISTGAPFNAEFRVLWPNGELHWLEARGTPLGSARHIWRGATIDITMRKRSEAILLQTEKLSVAGRVATSIAHEINNPLEAVTNLCFLARNAENLEDAQLYLDMAERELNRVAQFANHTLQFHRQQTFAVELDMGELIRSILQTYKERLAQRNIEVEFEVRHLLPLLCYEGEIRQAVATILVNALDAMPQGGMLRIRVGSGLNRTGRPAMLITIADTGHGMPPEIRQRIFEPFFTTRGAVGTGLGLWVAMGILERHAGTIRVRSSTGQRSGSVFLILLPYAESASAAQQD